MTPDPTTGVFRSLGFCNFLDMLFGLLFALQTEEPAPSWLPIIFLLIPVVIVTAVSVPMLRARARRNAGMKASRAGIAEAAVSIGSAAEITDGARYSVEGLRKALAIRPEDHGPTDEAPHDEGWAGTMLGLRSKMTSATEVLEAHFYWGERPQGRVFIRIGPDEKVEGGTVLGSNRHIRQFVALLVDSPEFKLTFPDGRPEVVAGSLPGSEAVFAEMAASSGIWQDVAAQGGPEGIVFSRDAISAPDFWVYDLWLVERLARELGLTTIDGGRLGPAWKLPYRVGRYGVRI